MGALRSGIDLGLEYLMTADAINLSQVSYQWPSQQHVTLAIDSLIIKQGERVLLTGQSGSGKTTLLNLLCGILSPSAGSIELLNQPLHSMSASQRDRFRAQHLGVIFQQFNLLPYLPVLDNVTLPCHFSKQRKHKAMPLNKTAAKLLEQLKLAPSLHQRPITELSVGQQQRVAVARALIGQPEIIIADEPTSALDHQRRDDFLALLFEQIEKTNGTLIFVSHDTSLAPHFSRVLELSALNQARGAHDPA